MRKTFLHLLLFMMLFLLAFSCGGSKHTIPDQPLPIGFIPFPTENLSGYLPELNHRLELALASSGAFQVVELQPNPGYFALDELVQRYGKSVSTASLPDSSTGDTLARQTETLPNRAGKNDTAIASETRQLPEWVLTGRFIQETEHVVRGTRIPFVLYKPAVILQSELEVRLFNRREKRWKDIRRIKASVRRAGSWQVIEFDPSHPSLAVDAPARAQLREALYDDLYRRLNHWLENMVRERQ